MIRHFLIFKVWGVIRDSLMPKQGSLINFLHYQQWSASSECSKGAGDRCHMHQVAQLLLSLDEHGALLSKIINPPNFMLILRKEHTNKSPSTTRKIPQIQLLFLYYFKQNTLDSTNFINWKMNTEASFYPKLQQDLIFTTVLCSSKAHSSQKLSTFQNLSCTPLPSTPFLQNWLFRETECR